MNYNQKILIALAYGAISCSNSGKNNIEDKTTVTDTITVSDIPSNSTNNDTIIYDNYYFPIDSTFTVKVLTTGTFHGDEVMDNVEEKKWLGLFKSKTGFYLGETKLKTKRIFDQILDEGANDKTGWEVRTINKDTTIILFEKPDYLTARNVQQVILPKKEIFPGDTIQFKYLDVDYKLFATGGKKKVDASSDWFTVWNYRLYLTATIKGKQRKSLLAAQPQFEDKMINIIFTGDIDGDGILDLIIDTSGHYNATSPTIYLSQPAGDEDIVKPIGGHTSVGC